MDHFLLVIYSLISISLSLSHLLKRNALLQYLIKSSLLKIFLYLFEKKNKQFIDTINILDLWFIEFYEEESQWYFQFFLSEQFKYDSSGIVSVYQLIFFTWQLNPIVQISYAKLFSNVGKIIFSRLENLLEYLTSSSEGNVQVFLPFFYFDLWKWKKIVCIILILLYYASGLWTH